MRNQYVNYLKSLKEDEIEKSFLSKAGKETDDLQKVTKVMVELSRQKSSAATKLASELKEIQILKKEYTDKEEALKDKAREYAEQFFDVEDQVWTRVMKTVSLIVTINKATERTSRTFDDEKFLIEILKLVPELKEQIEGLYNGFLSIKTSPVKSKVDVKTIDIESAETQMYEDFIGNTWEKLKDLGKRAYSKVVSWLPSFDKKLEAIESQLNQEINNI